MSAPVYQLIYTSCPCESLTPPVLSELMALSRRNNAREGITGILLHTEGQFMQVVEGPRAAVDRLMERIHKDTRHEDVRIVMAHTVMRRDFGEWDMALHALPREALGKSSALSEFFKPEFDIRSLRYGSPASFLLQAFRELHIEAVG
jgi:hypothetical protein